MSEGVIVFPRALALLDEPDAARIVPALPVQELYWAIQEVGLADARELLALASPEQVRGFIDLAAWRRGALDEERAAEWLDALADLGPEKLARAVEALDDELVALWLRRQVTVYDLSIEQPPDEPEGHYYPTPDRFYLLDVKPAGEAGKRVERLVDWLYRADVELGRRVVMAAKWESGAELEEQAWRWRSGRMADLGFVEFYEALEVYKYLDPSSVKVGEDTADARDPETRARALAPPLPAGSFLQRALASVDDEDERERLERALLVLANRVMAADAVEPGDAAGARATIERVAGFLSIGLEYVAKGDLAAARQALATIALVRLFRVGVSLAGKLAQAARTLVEKALAGRAALLDAPWRARLEKLLAVPVAVPVPASLAGVAEAAAFLDEVGQFLHTVVKGLGVDLARLTEERLGKTQPPAGALTFHTMVATIFANAILGRPPALVPLAPADVAPLREAVLLDGKLRPVAREAATRLVHDRLAERGVAEPPALAKWIDLWLAQLERALAPSAPASPAGALLPPEGLLVRA